MPGFPHTIFAFLSSAPEMHFWAIIDTTWPAGEETFTREEWANFVAPGNAISSRLWKEAVVGQGEILFASFVL